MPGFIASRFSAPTASEAVGAAALGGPWSIRRDHFLAFFRISRMPQSMAAAIREKTIMAMKVVV